MQFASTLPPPAKTEPVDKPAAPSTEQKKPFYQRKRFLMSVVLLIINVAILATTVSMASIISQNPEVDMKSLNHKYPGFMDMIVKHKGHFGAGDAEKCKDETSCQGEVTLDDLMTHHKIYPNAVKTEDLKSTLWIYYLNTVIRQQYEVIQSGSTCKSGVCGDNNEETGSCKWCDFNYANTTTSYSIQECVDNLSDRRWIGWINGGLHLLVVIILIGVLILTSKEDDKSIQGAIYIKSLVFLTASAYLVGNFGHVFITFLQDNSSRNNCAEILKLSERSGAIGYTVLSAAYFLLTLGFIAVYRGRGLLTGLKEKVKPEKQVKISYSSVPQVNGP